MTDLSSLTADQLAEKVRDPHKPDGCAWCRAVDETFRRLKTAEDALEQIAEPMPETEGDWGATYNWRETSARRRDLARAALAAIRPNPEGADEQAAMNADRLNEIREERRVALAQAQSAVRESLAALNSSLPHSAVADMNLKVAALWDAAWDTHNVFVAALSDAEQRAAQERYWRKRWKERAAQVEQERDKAQDSWRLAAAGLVKAEQERDEALAKHIEGKPIKAWFEATRAAEARATRLETALRNEVGNALADVLVADLAAEEDKA